MSFTYMMTHVDDYLLLLSHLVVGTCSFAAQDTAFTSSSRPRPSIDPQVAFHLES